MKDVKMQRISLLFDGVVIFHELNQDRVIHSLKTLLKLIASPENNLAEVYREYHRFCSLAIGANWPAHLWDLILEDENELTHQVARTNRKEIEKSLVELATRDILIWREISELTPTEIKEVIQKKFSLEEPDSQEIWLESPLSLSNWPNWTPGNSTFSTKEMSPAEIYLHTARSRVKEALANGNPIEMMGELISFYQRVGSGIFSRSFAYKWQSDLGHLKGVRPDPMHKSQLIGQEREQSIVLQNTEFFLSGYPANNVILYGNRGTGKSSLVKALLQEYYDQGLRLVELSKSDLKDYPKVIQLLGKQPQKFIVFIDDLSFEESEAEYKILKTLLEGGLEGKPQNVLIYATSNRRHLVRESFSERQGDEVNRRDNMEEKLSLADRFGITVTFPSPDQEGYLKIVEELATQQGIVIERESLRQQALRWVMQHNARSGRTARQFIDYLAASQGVAAK